MSEDDKRKGDEIQLVVFTIGGEEFGVDIGNVIEIIKMREITAVPNVPDYVNGILNLRGQIVTVFDLKKKLGCGEIEETPDTRIMIVSAHENTMGMVVDSVTEVMRISAEDVSEPPKNLASEIHRDFIEGVGKIDERLIILLSLEAVLLKEEVEDLKKAAREGK